MNEQQNAAFNDQIVTKQNHLPPEISRKKHADTSDRSAKEDNHSLNENKSKNNSLFPNNGARGDLLFNGFEGPVESADSRDGSEDNSGEQNAKKARSYAVSEALMPPEDYLEILRFRHYTHFWNFESKGKNSRRKSIINSIEVSVILHLVTVDSF